MKIRHYPYPPFLHKPSPNSQKIWDYLHDLIEHINQGDYEYVDAAEAFGERERVFLESDGIDDGDSNTAYLPFKPAYATAFHHSLLLSEDELRILRDTDYLVLHRGNLVNGVIRMDVEKPCVTLHKAYMTDLMNSTYCDYLGTNNTDYKTVTSVEAYSGGTGDTFLVLIFTTNAGETRCAMLYNGASAKVYAITSIKETNDNVDKRR